VKLIPPQVKPASILEQAENSSNTSELEVQFSALPSQNLSVGIDDQSILTNENKDWNSNDRTLK
jgi:hypothetical protein